MVTFEGNSYYNGNLDIEVDSVKYNVHVKATAYEYHDTGTMYFRDGSGEPPSDEFEIEELSFIAYDSTGNEVYDKNIQDSIESVLEDYLYDNSDLFEVPESYEPEEPEWEDE